MDTKKLVEGLIKKCGTNNPFKIAKTLNIEIIYSDMHNTLGFFSKYKRFKFIHLNQNTPKKLQTFVCCHELGHAIRHPDVNTPFLKQHTLYSTDRIERQANTFAVELLLPDQLLREYSECGLYNIADMVGIPPKLINLKRLEL